MARIRSLKPEAFESETLALVSVYAERTFYGMSTHADDRGRMPDKPAVINGKLWAVRSERELHSPKDLEDELQQLEAVGLICRYVGCDGKRYLHLVTWDDHQRVDKPGKPRTPRCPVHQLEDECGRHAMEPCPEPPPGSKSRDSREGSGHPRESPARSREDSRVLDSGGSGANQTRAGAVPPSADTGETGSAYDGGPGGADVVVLADRLRDQQKQKPSDNLPESSRDSRESSPLDLGPRSKDLGPRNTAVPPSAGPDEPGEEFTLISPPATAEPTKARKSRKRKPGRTALDDQTDVLTNGYWDRYGSTTAQSWIAVRQVVLGALKNACGDDPPDPPQAPVEIRNQFAFALDALGQAGRPVTQNTLTFALAEVRQPGMQPTGTGGHTPYQNPDDDSIYEEPLG